jgi:hypothetical protein
MTMYPHATFFAKTFTAIALLLSFGLVGQTCSTQSPEEVLEGGGDDDDIIIPPPPGGGGGGVPPLPDQGPSSPEHGALILDGRPLILDAQPNAQIVDCHSVISVYYSESMKLKTITSGSFILRKKFFSSSVSTNLTWLMGNRLLIIEPQDLLSPSTTYQLTAVVGPVDLDGLAYDPGDSPVIIEFTTAATADGIPPEILASYPLNSSTNQPNDSQAVVVFSKPIDTTTISAAIGFSNQTTLLPADYDTVAGYEAELSQRVVSFAHQNDGNDLNADIQLDVSTSIFDNSFEGLGMLFPYTSSWGNMNLQRPQKIQFDLVAFDGFSPAANLNNHRDFPLEVLMPLSATPAVVVNLRVHQFDDTHSDDYRLVESDSVAGAGTVGFTLDLNEDVSGISVPVFELDSEMLIGAYLDRDGDGVRTTVSLHLGTDGEFEEIPHDLVPPSFSSGLFKFGPPFGSFASQFRSTLPIVRPYGVASEAIGEVIVDGDSRMVPRVSDDTFFIGSSINPFLVEITDDPRAFEFELELADAAGNLSLEPLTSFAHFSGFVGGSELVGGDIRVIALDGQDLTEILGAIIHIEEFGDSLGLTADMDTSASDGSVTFPGRAGKQTVTIQHPDYQATTIMGVNASVISLLLTPAVPNLMPVSPTIIDTDGDFTGTRQINSNTLATRLDEPAEFMVQDYNRDLAFGAGAVLSQPNQPGWFVCFDEFKEYDGTVQNCFRFVGLEEHVIVAPSVYVPDEGLNESVRPSIELAESSNIVTGGTPTHLYGITATEPTDDFGNVEDEGTYLSTVIPGLKGPVVVGAGVVDFGWVGLGLPRNGAAELEINLFNEAQQEGASPPGEITVNVYASDDDGNQVSRAGASTAISLLQQDFSIAMPEVPIVGDWLDNVGDPLVFPVDLTDYPFDAVFIDTLVDEGMYEITIKDSFSSTWNVIVMDSVVGIPNVDGEVLVKLPFLQGGLAIPLSINAGVVWKSDVAAYDMGSSFDEIGFFFDAVKRDRVSWAKSALTPVVGF